MVDCLSDMTGSFTRAQPINIDTARIIAHFNLVTALRISMGHSRPENILKIKTTIKTRNFRLLFRLIDLDGMEVAPSQIVRNVNQGRSATVSRERCNCPARRWLDLKPAETEPLPWV